MDAVTAIRNRADAKAFEALYREWGNDFSFRPGGLAHLYDLALMAKKPILECGSGLSSIVLGLAAERAGVPVHALETSPEWAARLQSALYSSNIKTVSIHLCDHADGWLALPDGLPDEYGLVFVDGPQDYSRGMVYDRLVDQISDAHVVADDIHIRQFGRPFDLWVISAGRIAERSGGYAIARTS